MGSQPEPAPALRLAILEADTPLPGTQAKYKTYGGVFTNLFTRATAPEPVESVLRITQHDVVNDLSSYPALDDIDAMLITGSKHSAYENGEWIVRLVEFTQKAVASGRVKVVGVCFGHQIVGRALGVPVDRNDKGWEVSVTELKLSEEGKKLFGLEKLRIHQMHRDAVFSYPAGAIPLAETDVCPVQGMLIPGKVITVQGHPEFTEGIVREILEARHAIAIFSDEVYESGIDRVANDHDGVAIARAFIKFMQGQ